jgi:hypothetical protein
LSRRLDFVGSEPELKKLQPRLEKTKNSPKIFLNGEKKFAIHV